MGVILRKQNKIIKKKVGQGAHRADEVGGRGLGGIQ